MKKKAAAPGRIRPRYGCSYFCVLCTFWFCSARSDYGDACFRLRCLLRHLDSEASARCTVDHIVYCALFRLYIQLNALELFRCVAQVILPYIFGNLNQSLSCVFLACKLNAYLSLYSSCFCCALCRRFLFSGCLCCCGLLCSCFLCCGLFLCFSCSCCFCFNCFFFCLCFNSLSLWFFGLYCRNSLMISSLTPRYPFSLSYHYLAITWI